MSNIKNIMLLAPDTVKGASDINFNVDDSAISSAIRTAQNVHLQDIIGSELLKKLQSLIMQAIDEEGTGIDAKEYEEYKTLLDEYIEPYLIAKTQVEICLPISLKIRNIGVSQDSDTNINGSALENIKYLRDNYETSACEYATRLSQYLCSNKSAFPELDVKTNGCKCGFVKPKIGKRFANTKLWLGGNKGCLCR